VSTLEQWRFEPDGGDWDDVLRRARRRVPLPGRALVAAAAVLVLAGPALGLVTSLGGGHERPRLTAELTGPGGATGTFTAFSPGFWIARHGGRRLPFTLRRPLLVGWSVRVPGTVTAVRIRTTTLCDPCARPGGVLRMTPTAALHLLTGGPVVTVTAGGTTLRGKLMLSRH
jgi:hypothetical protein